VIGSAIAMTFVSAPETRRSRTERYVDVFAVVLVSG